MSDRVKDYLRELAAELAGADAALVQDALADAEDHLRTALETTRRSAPDTGEDEALQQVIDAYGTPAEIAAAYRDFETRTSPPRPLPAPRGDGGGSSIGRFVHVLVDPGAYAALFYISFSLITGIIYFSWTTVGISLSAGLIVLIIGLPFFGLFLLSVQGMALVEGRLVEALLGVRMPRRPVFPGVRKGVWHRFTSLVRDPRTWSTILYMMVQLPLGVIYFTVFTVMIAFGLAGIATPVLELGFGIPLCQFNDYAFHVPVVLMPLVVLVGAIWILLVMHLAKWLGRVHGKYAKALLVRRGPA